jgi:predicted dithiol-disulfide oxidoreductase (DUF899 family)
MNQSSGTNNLRGDRIDLRQEWLVERTAFLALEEVLTRLRQELAKRRHYLPWPGVDKRYVFDRPDGQETLGELFATRRQAIQSETVCYKYTETAARPTEREGISVFCKDAVATVFPSYSCYARGIAMVNGTYRFLDLTPKGRNGDPLESRQACVKYHDRYDSRSPNDR